MEIQVGKQSLAFAEAPYIISSASIVGKKEGEGPLGNRFDVVGEDDKFGQNTWEEAESTLNGPVSASPSPTTQAAIRLGLSATAPKAWARE